MAAQFALLVRDVVAVLPVALKLSFTAMVIRDMPLQIHVVGIPVQAEGTLESRFVVLLVGVLLMRFHLAGASRREVAAFFGALHCAVGPGEHRVAHFVRSFVRTKVVE